mmetsp:Transcript_18090/g.23802  ORF Transcript_18090/g.23802 Transcript_18090/m.23802 type:complete len:334 (-) Transcript_18090:234-1235(-)
MTVSYKKELKESSPCKFYFLLHSLVTITTALFFAVAASRYQNRLTAVFQYIECPQCCICPLIGRTDNITCPAINKCASGGCPLTFSTGIDETDDSCNYVSFVDSSPLDGTCGPNPGESSNGKIVMGLSILFLFAKLCSILVMHILKFGSEDDTLVWSRASLVLNFTLWSSSFVIMTGAKNLFEQFGPPDLEIFCPPSYRILTVFEAANCISIYCMCCFFVFMFFTFVRGLDDKFECWASLSYWSQSCSFGCHLIWCFAVFFCLVVFMGLIGSEPDSIFDMHLFLYSKTTVAWDSGILLGFNVMLTFDFLFGAINHYLDFKQSACNQSLKISPV